MFVLFCIDRKIQLNSSPWPHLLCLQKIILEGKVATDYDYHGVAAPWIQIKILKILGLLGADNEK